MAAKKFKQGSGRIGYPSDVTDEEWAFCAPYLTLMVERSFAWALRFRRLARDYERLPQSVAGLHWLAFLTLMLNSFFHQSA